jgi:hypothetical protein
MTCPRKIPHSDVESVHEKEQPHEEEPFHRGADYRDDQGAGGRAADCGCLPQAWTEHGDVLQAEGQIRRIEVSDARRLRQLEDENGKLKRLLADSMLDNVILKDLLGKV